MEAEGRVMRNCLASLVPRVLSGEAYYYRWVGEERATVEVGRVDERTWRIVHVEPPVAAAFRAAPLALALRPTVSIDSRGPTVG